MNRKEKIILYSNKIGKKLNVSLVNEELNYGRGIGRADNYCIVNDWHVVIEMEFSQRHPEMNVMKAWPFLETNPNKKILLIQQLIDVKSVSPNRIKLCNWVAQKIEENMKGRFYYFLLKNDLDKKTLEGIMAQMKQLKIV